MADAEGAMSRLAEHQTGSLLLESGACWWPADRRCVGEPQEQRWWSKGAS